MCGRFALGVHRAVLLNELDAPIAVVSQMDIVKHLVEYSTSRLGDSLRQTVRFRITLLNTLNTLYHFNIDINRDFYNIKR